MPGWKEEYLSSILEAEKSNPVNQELVEACKFALRSQGPRTSLASLNKNTPYID
jgi:hypothetical protein